MIWSDKFVRCFQNSAYIKLVRVWNNSTAFTLKAHDCKETALSEACEVSCDMAVTKNMSEEEQKLYMQTNLNLATERSKRC